MAVTNEGQLIVSELPETGEIPFTELRQRLTVAGKGKALTAFHEARRGGEFFTGFRKGVLVVSRHEIEREKRTSGLSAVQGGGE